MSDERKVDPSVKRGVTLAGARGAGALLLRVQDGEGVIGLRGTVPALTDRAGLARLTRLVDDIHFQAGLRKCTVVELTDEEFEAALRQAFLVN